MSELLDQSVQQVTSEFLDAPIQQVEDEGDHYPILPNFFAEKLIDSLGETARVALLLEALADPKGVMLDELGGSLTTGPDAIPMICATVIGSKAEEEQGVPERMREQWKAYWEAHPEGD